MTISTQTSDPKLQKKEEEKHKKWIQWYNKGISHFGLHPSLLPLSAIRCDVFHMGCSVGRRLIDYLRDFSILQGYNFEFKLFGILNEVWSESVQCLWRLNKKVSQLLGVEIKAFVLKYPDIANLLRSKEGRLEQIEELVSLARALDLWYPLTTERLCTQKASTRTLI